ncbi:GbsR/MarR family transcriptional regulator [Salinimicrobium sp. GXAS 041]|uniref:GbsR/MarR family transcriptional regulator n=1 Tax=Salinimicrobium sp. GXAS 041 TaxID=3400806 RepID=UPI003C793265
MQKEDLEIQKRRLIEQLGVHLEGENLAPLAARIFATLILTGKKGITFEELVNDLCAGKSSISTHLDHLQATNRVKYYTKPGDRKRYFIINPDLMLNIIDEKINRWENEKKIHIEIQQYKKRKNEMCREDEDFKFDLEFQEDFLTFLEETTAAVQKFKSKILSRNS